MKIHQTKILITLLSLATFAMCLPADATDFRFRFVDDLQMENTSGSGTHLVTSGTLTWIDGLEHYAIDGGTSTDDAGTAATRHYTKPKSAPIAADHRPPWIPEKDYPAE